MVLSNISLPCCRMNHEQDIGYAISAREGLEVQISNTCFLENNFTGLGAAEMFGTYVESNFNYGTQDDGLECQFIAFSVEAIPQSFEDVTCFPYSESTCTASTYTDDDGRTSPNPASMTTQEPTEPPSAFSSTPTNTAAGSATNSSEPIPCLICASGVTMLKSNWVIPGTENVTCGEFQSLLTMSGSDAECLSLIEDLDLQLFDLAAWCGCEFVSQPDLCQICGDGGELINNDADIIVPGLEARMKCKQAAEIAPYITEEYICGSFPFVVDPVCCSSSPQVSVDSAVPTPLSPVAPLPEPPVVPPPPACSICGTASSMQWLSQEVLLGDDLQCKDLSRDAETCATFRAASDVYTVEGWCGCTGASLPSLCAACDEGQVVAEADLRRAVYIPTFNQTFQCQVAVTLPIFASTLATCKQIAAAAKAQCCSGAASNDSATSALSRTGIFVSSSLMCLVLLFLLPS